MLAPQVPTTDGVLDPPIHELNRERAAAKAGVRTLADAEREHILETLRETEWVVGGPHGASALLGVKRTTLLDKMHRLGISRPTRLTGICRHLDEYTAFSSRARNR